jgi:CelD/BcsL family acetyltransferase involved in cellulose biosynthesis
MIKVASPAPAEVWEGVGSADPSATFFQTPAWSRLVSNMGLGFTDTSVLVRLQDDALAVLPRMHRTRGRVFRQIESVPVGLYGAPISERPLTAAEMLTLAGYYRPRRSSGALLVEAPHGTIDLGVPRKTMTTQILRWSAGTEAAVIVQGYRKGHRTAIRKAEREGVVVARAASMSDFLDYHGVYLETLQRWTRPPGTLYSAELFRELCTISERDPRIRLWLARRDGRLLAGALAFHQGGGAAYWHGASTEEGRQSNAGNVAVHAALMDSLESGRTRFDFLPSAGLTDVEHFKAGFGPEIVEVGVHHFNGSPLWRFLSAARERVLGLPQERP